MAVALDADFSGHEAFHAAADNYLEMPIEEALSESSSTNYQTTVPSRATILPCRWGKAEEVLNWKLDHSSRWA